MLFITNLFVKKKQSRHLRAGTIGPSCCPDTRLILAENTRGEGILPYIWAFLVWIWVYTLPILEICKFEMHLKKFFLPYNLNKCWHNFCLKARSENGYEFWRSGLKTGVEKHIFWSETGSGGGEPGGTPLPRIPGSTPRGKTSLGQVFPCRLLFIARTQR